MRMFMKDSARQPVETGSEHVVAVTPSASPGTFIPTPLLVTNPPKLTNP